MILRVDPEAPTPPYEQLRSQLTAMIVGKVLPAGERMPSIRQLAGDLRLAPGTVRRAYTELEREGLLQTRRGRHGTVVADVQATPPDADRRSVLRQAAVRYAVAAAQAGADADEALAEARTALTELSARN